MINPSLKSYPCHNPNHKPRPPFNFILFLITFFPFSFVFSTKSYFNLCVIFALTFFLSFTRALHLISILSLLDFSLDLLSSFLSSFLSLSLFFSHGFSSLSQCSPQASFYATTMLLSTSIVHP